MKKQEILRTLFFMLGAITMILMSLHYFDNQESGIQYDRESYNVILSVHIVCGCIAILIGPFQFLQQSVKKKWHRKVGYMYASSVWLGSITGLIIASQAMGGWITSLGFSSLALYWFYSMTMAIVTIKQGDVESHRRWMLHNYACTFAAVTLRTMLALALIPGVKFILVYQQASWTSWLLNILIVELWLIWKKKNNVSWT